MQKMIPNDILLAEVGKFLDEGKDVEILTKGNSMNPFIRGEVDSVRLRKIPAGSLSAGDIALAEVAPGSYVLHRIMSISNGEVTLMGDGNVRRCEHCRIEKILGTVTAVVRPSGRLARPWKALLWRHLGPRSRGLLLAFYRRLFI